MAQRLTDIRAMLDAAGLRPQKAFGQNFLIDHNLLAEIVAMADLSPGEAVLEIGPGTGALTDLLLDAGARVLAVEIDRGLAALLRDRYAGTSAFDLLEADALAGKHSLNPLLVRRAAALADGGPIKLIANLPYNVATPLVCELLMLAERHRRGLPDGLSLASMTVTVQKEAAVRFCCGPETPDQYGPVAILCRLLGRATPGRVLPPEAFWPRPKVTSQIVAVACGADQLIAADPPVDLQTLANVLTGCFAQRRKKISSAWSRCKDKYDSDLWSVALAGCGIEPDWRAENVPPGHYARLARRLGGGR